MGQADLSSSAALFKPLVMAAMRLSQKGGDKGKKKAEAKAKLKMKVSVKRG